MADAGKDPTSSNVASKMDTLRSSKKRSGSAAPSSHSPVEAAEDTVRTKKPKIMKELDAACESDSNRSYSSYHHPYSQVYVGGHDHNPATTIQTSDPDEAHDESSYHHPYSQMYVGGHDPHPADVTTIPTSDPEEAQEDISRNRNEMTSHSSSTPFKRARSISNPCQNHSAGSLYYARIYNKDVFRRTGKDNSVTLPESVDLSALGLENVNDDTPAHTATVRGLTISENIGGVADTSDVLPSINDRKRIPLNAYLKFWSKVDYICSRLPKETPMMRFPILAACVKGPIEIIQNNGSVRETVHYINEQRKRVIAEFGQSNGIQSEQFGVVDYLHHSLSDSFEAVATGNIDKLHEIIRALESGSSFLKILVNLDLKVRERAEGMS